MKSSFGKFRLETPFGVVNKANGLFSAATGPATAMDGPAAVPATAQTSSMLTFTLTPALRDVSAQKNTQTPPTPTPRPILEPDAAHGFLYDREQGGYSLEFNTEAHFEGWLFEQRRTRAVEFRRRRIEHCKMPDGQRAWLTRTTYTCTRDGDSRVDEYERTKPERKTKAFKKELSDGCSALVTMKTYPDTRRVLVKHRDEHSHPLGVENVPYMTLSKQRREEIGERLADGESGKALYKSLKREVVADVTVGTLASVDRDQQVKREDISRIQARIRAELYRLDPEDDQSVLAYAKQLREDGHFAFIKTRRDAAPEGSGLAPDSFVLVIQVRYQQECWYHYGHDRFVGIDATHNMTHYREVNLFSLVVRDDWGHGVPTAYMLSSLKDEVTIRWFLGRVQMWSPEVVPRVWMSDKDRAQINAVLAVYTTAWLLLCRWHVLHAWHQNLSIDAFPDLWALLQKLAYADQKPEFDRLLVQIKDLGPRKCPPSFLEYLDEHWLTDFWLPKWAPYFRVNRTVFQESDTNMLVESMHHFYKDYIADGQRNKRMDLTIHQLIVDVIEHMQARHQQQLAGVHGHNLEQAARVEVLKRAADIPRETIALPTATSPFYVVLSQSATNPFTFYNVDISSVPARCSCTSYPRLQFCTHVAAVGRYYPDSKVDIQIYPSSYRTRLHPQINASGPRASVEVSAPLPLRPIQAISDIAAAASHQLSKALISLAADVQANPRPLEELGPLQAAVAQFSQPVSQVLPAKLKLGNNKKHDWDETAKNMGSAKRKKRARVGESAEIGIGPRKMKKTTYTDPYSAGERSGKRAKPDALRVPSPEPEMVHFDEPPTRCMTPPFVDDALIWRPSPSPPASPCSPDIPPPPAPFSLAYDYSLPAGPVYQDVPPTSGPIYLDRPFGAAAPVFPLGPMYF
uniref:SWIM-type domain-containing protein n=1 Tax=Mycena chlorophos TaxID=658473 RepID=A0ABQ0LJQ0_MYCCL|nr:predicted protein [Mycena chlorophos]